MIPCCDYFANFAASSAISARRSKIVNSFSSNQVQIQEMGGRGHCNIFANVVNTDTIFHFFELYGEQSHSNISIWTDIELDCNTHVFHVEEFKELQILELIVAILQCYVAISWFFY